jgi:[ribosomal protein S5]-alanine N-acetyltransferase
MPWPPSHPEFLTPRLQLRMLRMEDANAVFMLRSNAQVNLYINRKPCTAVDQAQEFIRFINQGIEKNENLYWAIARKENGQLIGTICLWNYMPEKASIEVGYEMLPPYQGQGYMNEAMETIIDWAFAQLSVKKIEAFTHPENKASEKLLLRNGFVYHPGLYNEEEGLAVFVLPKGKW